MQPREQIALFAAKVDELRRTRLLRDGGLRSGISIQWEATQGGRIIPKEPDEDDLRSFLVTFRQFMMKKEAVYLYRIYNHCHRFTTSDLIRGYLVKSRGFWTAALTTVSLRVRGKDMVPEHLADLWINGLYFHSTDTAKRQELASLLPPEQMFAKQAFLDFLIAATRQVIYVGNTVVVGLKEGWLAAP